MYLALEPKKTSLTGIKPTGSLHIGNYFGAIKPALALAAECNALYFIADYHALNSMRDGAELALRIREVAAGWLASGLDPEKVVFYRQSDVKETFELATMLSCFAAKGLLNRAHAYKAAVEANLEKGQDQDAGINMGLFTYPVLMAADILLFEPDYVPVGQDQSQHVEMAADIAGVLNHNYKKAAGGAALLKIPAPLIQKSTGIVPGLDGRKMSKSYNNYIPLFCAEGELRKMCMRIVTNSQGVDEPKDPDASQIFQIYKLFATEDEAATLAKRYREGGMGWGEAKEALFTAANRTLSPLREKYNALIDSPDTLRRILKDGAEKARQAASKTLSKLRAAAGLEF